MGFKIPGWGTAVGALASVADKLIPSRKEKLAAQLQDLSRQYREALVSGDDVKASQLDRRLRELRKRVDKI